MDDNLGRRLEEINARVPEGNADLNAVLKGGHRMARRRALASTAGVIGMISLLAFGALNLDFNEPQPGPVQPATHDDGVFVPAEPGEPTYILTDLKILPGPYKDRGCLRRQRTPSLCSTSSMVGVAYEWRWSTDAHPGLVQCRVEVFKGDDPVGHATWELSGLEPTSRRLDVIPVPISGRWPDRVEGACEAETPQTGPTHRFTFVRAESYDARVGSGTESLYRNRLYFEVESLTQHATGMCTLTITYESGKEISNSFTMTGAPPERKLFEIVAPYREGEPVADASISCPAYTGDGG